MGKSWIITEVITEVVEKKSSPGCWTIIVVIFFIILAIIGAFSGEKKPKPSNYNPVEIEENEKNYKKEDIPAIPAKENESKPQPSTIGNDADFSPNYKFQEKKVSNDKKEYDEEKVIVDSISEQDEFLETINSLEKQTRKEKREKRRQEKNKK